MDTDVPLARTLRPGAPAPTLTLPLVGGDTFRLTDATPRLFTMLVFNRGLHCPVCHAQLAELERRCDELAEKGIDVVSISAETEQRATQMHADWGLFVSRAINDSEPPVFNEPGLFLISPDASVYYESILSMPVGRPRLDDLLGGIAFWTEHAYPARGGD